VWQSTRKLLDALALLPLAEAFQRIPATVTNTFGPYLSSARPGRHAQWEVRRERLALLARDYVQVKEHLPNALHYLADLPEAMTNPDTGAPAKPADILKAARACLLVLHHVWSNPALAKKFAGGTSPQTEKAPAPALAPEKQVRSEGEEARSNEDTKPAPSSDTDKQVRDWLALVQDFVALEVTVYLSQFFVHLRNLIVFLTVAPFLMLLAVTSYPFQPQRLWLLLAATLIGVGTATAVWIVIQIERNEVVSHILSTTPNSLNFHWDFIARLLLYAAPLLGIVAAASSDVSDLVHSLVDPRGLARR
jgi:hypothetical protein